MPFSSFESYARDVLDEPAWGVSILDRHHIARLGSVIPAFLERVFRSTDWSQYDVVGFTSTFEQTMPSLCLARMIRERCPGITLVFGGANFEAEMGRAFAAALDVIDYVSLGEADASFPRLCLELQAAKARGVDPGAPPPGFVRRLGGALLEARDDGADVPLVALDETPVPDYHAYFAQRALVDVPHSDAVPWVPIEAARGCWWGQKSHCTFCGLNGASMEFRKKSAARLLFEIAELEARHGTLAYQFTDNILATEYFKDLIPTWASEREPSAKFFEVKSNLKRDEIALLRRAGVVMVQAGVESLADGTLRVMRKGVTGAQNVALLRWCHEVGLSPLWNIIYGFPHEDADDYQRTATAMKKLVHLRPPVACTIIRMDRFSPNHQQASARGFTRVSPAPAYRHVFPFPEETLSQVAYYFSYEHPRMADCMARANEILEVFEGWRAAFSEERQGELAVRPHWQGGYVLIDSRYNRQARSERLSAEALSLLLACDAPAPVEFVLSRAQTLSPSLDFARLAAEYERLMAADVIATLGAQSITLPLLPDALRAEFGTQAGRSTWDSVAMSSPRTTLPVVRS